MKTRVPPPSPWPDSAVDQRIDDSIPATERMQISTKDVEKKDIENIHIKEMEQKNHRVSKKNQRREAKNTSKNITENCKWKNKK